MAEPLHRDPERAARTTCRCQRYHGAARHLHRAVGSLGHCTRGDRRRAGQSVEAQRPRCCLRLSAHRTTRASAADRLGRDPRRTRLHAAVALRLPRSFRRVETARRQCPVRAFDPGGCLPTGGRRAWLPLPFAILSDAELKLTHAMRLPTFAVDGADVDQTHGLGHRRRRHHPRVLSAVSAGPERWRGRRLAQTLTRPDTALSRRSRPRSSSSSTRLVPVGRSGRHKKPRPRARSSRSRIRHPNRACSTADNTDDNRSDQEE